jgi:hypothetical protein
MTIINFNEIAKQYSNIVQDYLSKGYTIYPTSTKSFSNVISYTDLMNLKDKSTITRVWLFNDIFKNVTECSYSKIHTLKLRVTKYKMVNKVLSNGKTVLSVPALTLLDPCCGTEITYEKTFYNISYKVYSDQLDEMNRVNRIRNERSTYKCKTKEIYIAELSKLTPSLVDKIMSHINKVTEFKRATSTCITRVALGKDYKGKSCAEVSYTFKNKSGSLSFK